MPRPSHPRTNERKTSDEHSLEKNFLLNSYWILQQFSCHYSVTFAKRKIPAQSHPFHDSHFLFYDFYHAQMIVLGSFLGLLECLYQNESFVGLGKSWLKKTLNAWRFVVAFLLLFLFLFPQQFFDPVWWIMRFPLHR